MTIAGIGSTIAASVQSQTALQTQLDTLSRQLGTGQKAAVYSDLGPQAGLTVGLDAQLAAIDGFNSTNTIVTTTTSIEQQALTQLASVQSSVQQAADTNPAFTLDNNGRTSTQEAAATQLGQIIDLLNTQSGNNFLFSGSALTQSSTAPLSEILNGTGTRAGFNQVLSERTQADLGANGLGRLVVTGPTVPNPTTVTLNEDVPGSPFGLKLAGVNSSLTGATVTGPAPVPPGPPAGPNTISVDLPTNPNPGDSISFALTLPDGTSQTVTLQATSSPTPGPNQFTIDAIPANTADNLQAALTTAIGNLAQTQLPAASAVAAAGNFFESDPPQRVAGPPFDTATALVNGTSANTVFWYTGENGGTPARQTQLAQVAPSLSISYGIRAIEPAISNLVANVAALAATSYSAGNPNAKASYQALTSRVATNLAGQQGTQQISDIESDIANAQVAAKNAQSENQQTQSTIQNLLQGINGISQAEIGTEILTIQNALQASYSTTARLSQLSLVNFLSAAPGG